MQVSITAVGSVQFNKVVEMNEEDYQEYLKIIDSGKSNREIDYLVTELAGKYRFYGSGDDIFDLTDPEEIEFTPIV